MKPIFIFFALIFQLHHPNSFATTTSHERRFSDFTAQVWLYLFMTKELSCSLIECPDLSLDQLASIQNSPAAERSRARYSLALQLERFFTQAMNREPKHGSRATVVQVSRLLEDLTLEEFALALDQLYL